MENKKALKKQNGEKIVLQYTQINKCKEIPFHSEIKNKKDRH